MGGFGQLDKTAHVCIYTVYCMHMKPMCDRGGGKREKETDGRRESNIEQGTGERE